MTSIVVVHAAKSCAIEWSRGVSYPASAKDGASRHRLQPFYHCASHLVPSDSLALSIAFLYRHCFGLPAPTRSSIVCAASRTCDTQSSLPERLSSCPVAYQHITIYINHIHHTQHACPRPFLPFRRRALFNRQHHNVHSPQQAPILRIWLQLRKLALG